jgi:hypothetical protein
MVAAGVILQTKENRVRIMLLFVMEAERIQNWDVEGITRDFRL